ncbi:MAG: hypothetical protein JW854_04810 [Actinobacteria bacterium]|nr:hypothetical protein [Actinomycetota bacterium]
MDEGLGVNGMGFMSYGKRCGQGRGRRSFRAWSLHAIPLILACVLLPPLAVGAAGCGEPPETRAEEEVVAERVLLAALNGERSEFVTLVAPSFLAEVRAEMPDSDDETIGGVLIAGMLEGIPFAGIIEACYSVWEYSQQTVAVYVSGRFVDAGGAEITISEADAIRIPLVSEDGRWYLDLLDL